MKRIIINADDFGLSDGICRAINNLFDIEAISSTTIMTASNGSFARCQNWNIKRHLGKVGVHLQLTDGYPVLSSSEVPGLINKKTGSFLPKSELPNLNPEEVQKEWRAQIQKTHDILKGKPSHIDSHHGAHHIPGLAEVFINLALEFNLPVRDCSAMNEFIPTAKISGSDIVMYEWTAKGLSEKDFQMELMNVTNEENTQAIYEVVSHPGFSDNQLRKISSLNDLREKDYEVLVNLANSKWLAAQNFEIISFSQI